MNRTEITFAKTGALTTRDWDTYQAILRKCLRNKKVEQKPEIPKQLATLKGRTPICVACIF